MPVLRGISDMECSLIVQSETLFGFLADSLATFAPECIGASSSTRLGFTFSFPVNHVGLREGVLTTWTKGFSAKGCVGENVVDLLTKELDKRVCMYVCMYVCRTYVCLNLTLF